MAAVCENGGAAIQAVDGFSPGYNLLMSLDCSGNLSVKGMIVSGGSLMVASKTAAGPDVAAYSPRETEPTIEDFGEARLVNGSTHVDISADFGRTIDPREAYLVFITPEGDCRGLFVTNRSRNGFDVRESQGGTANLGFAYRIVARPLGSNDGRLPTMDSVRAREALNMHRRGFNLHDALRQLGVWNVAPPHVTPK